MRGLESELERLVRATRVSDGPAPQDRARIGQKLAARLGDAALLAAIAAPASAGAPAAGLLASGKGLVASKIGTLIGGAKLVGVLIVTAGLAAVAVPQARQAVLRTLGAASPAASHVTSPLASAVAPLPALVASTPVVVSAPSSPALPASPAAAEATDPSGAVLRRRAPSAAASASARAEGTLAPEARLLQQAQQALREGRPGLALAALTEHDRQFKPGALHEEVVAVRVLALCALGRREDAVQAARSFLRQSPRSPLAPQVRGSCAHVAEATQ